MRLPPPQPDGMTKTLKRMSAAAATATVIALILAALPLGTAFAHGSPNPKKPIHASCFYYNKATNSHSCYSGSVHIGTYEVWVAENSCVASNFEVGGYFDGSAGKETGCSSATVAINGTVNGVDVSQFDGSTFE